MSYTPGLWGNRRSSGLKILWIENPLANPLANGLTDNANIISPFQGFIWVFNENSIIISTLRV